MLFRSAVGDVAKTTSVGLAGVNATGATGYVVPIYWKLIDNSEQAYWALINGMVSTTWNEINTENSNQWNVIDNKT